MTMNVYCNPFTPTSLPAAKVKPDLTKHAVRARAAEWRKANGGYSIGGRR